MKNLVLSLFLSLMMGLSMQAQITVPAPSPLAKMEQIVGLTEVHLEYSRPSAKGRTIFGGLVPYNKLWRTGANAATKVTFSEDVVIEGQELEAGSYALFTIPGENEWTIILNTDTEQGGTGNYDEEKDALRVTVKPQSLTEFVETFTIGINNITSSSATLNLRWENTEVIVPFTVYTDDQVEANIAAVMAGPSARDYYNAASYYLAEGKDPNQALVWINKHLEMDEPKFWTLLAKSKIQAEAGDLKGAIQTAEQSKKMAMEAGYDVYVKRNEDNIAMWKKKM
ncbi:MAG: DUF2911 domain-containing protein [Bacteroidetes bacterium]|jgi:hypothetical protein|nr:DUF2911 domain-containing protein [Bacteroidota bacterium]